MKPDGASYAMVSEGLHGCFSVAIFSAVWSLFIVFIQPQVKVCLQVLDGIVDFLGLTPDFR